jgi:hypothetical protein
MFLSLILWANKSRQKDPWCHETYSTLSIERVNMFQSEVKTEGSASGKSIPSLHVSRDAALPPSHPSTSSSLFGQGPRPSLDAETNSAYKRQKGYKIKSDAFRVDTCIKFIVIVCYASPPVSLLIVLLRLPSRSSIWNWSKLQLSTVTTWNRMFLEKLIVPLVLVKLSAFF